MKKQKRKSLHQEKLSWDDMTYGEASHHIGKKTTEKVHKSQKDYNRKPKHRKNWNIEDDE
jgi:hypothetical protein